MDVKVELKLSFTGQDDASDSAVHIVSSLLLGLAYLLDTDAWESHISPSVNAFKVAQWMGDCKGPYSMTLSVIRSLL